MAGREARGGGCYANGCAVHEIETQGFYIPGQMLPRHKAVGSADRKWERWEDLMGPPGPPGDSAARAIIENTAMNYLSGRILSKYPPHSDN